MLLSVQKCRLEAFDKKKRSVLKVVSWSHVGDVL